MKNVKSCVNRFGFRLSVGQTVKLHPVNSSPSIGTIKSFDFASDFAKAYGARVSFSDSPYNVAIDDCSAV
jgi:hypothetical protein